MSRTPKAAAGPNQLREVLRQQLLTTFAANKREPAMGEGTQAVEDSSPAASGEPSKKQPLSVVSATSCGCHKYDDMHVHVTVLCPCSRPTTTDRATQTDMARTDEQQRSTPRGAGISVDHLQTSNERVFSQTCSHELGASVPNGTPVTLSLQGTPNSADISGKRGTQHTKFSTALTPRGSRPPTGGAAFARRWPACGTRCSRRSGTRLAPWLPLPEPPYSRASFPPCQPRRLRHRPQRSRSPRCFGHMPVAIPMPS
ncbi:uncharacterized protein LOC144093905 [Amblyomma americanum]